MTSVIALHSPFLASEHFSSFPEAQPLPLLQQAQDSCTPAQDECVIIDRQGHHDVPSLWSIVLIVSGARIATCQSSGYNDPGVLQIDNRMVSASRQIEVFGCTSTQPHLEMPWKKRVEWYLIYGGIHRPRHEIIQINTPLPDFTYHALLVSITRAGLLGLLSWAGLASNFFRLNLGGGRRRHEKTRNADSGKF
jgi:hypothetical protein